MRKEAEMWMEDAEYDLGCAKDLLEKERYNYAVFFSRQAVEKILKSAYLAVLGKSFPKEHNLIVLAKEIFQEIDDNIMGNITFLNPHYTVTRYVNASLDIPSKLYDRRFAEQSTQKAEEVLKWVKTKITS